MYKLKIKGKGGKATMERREKIQGFIKKHIYLKKRKPTDSIFAEKRSSVAITFALMLPVFAIMFFTAFNIYGAYYAEELLSMGLDGAAMLISASGYEESLNNASGDSVGYNAQVLLGTAFCQYSALYECWGWGQHPLTPNNVSQWQWVQVNPALGGIIQAKGYLNSAFSGLGINGSLLTSSGITARSVVRFIN